MMSTFFPTIKMISQDNRFIYLYTTTLPPKPWPKTMGGVPLHFRLYAPESEPGPRDSLLPLHRDVSNIDGCVLATDRDYRNVQDWTPLFHRVLGHFDVLQMSGIKEVIYWGTAVTVVLQGDGGEGLLGLDGLLPRRVGGVECFYMVDGEMGRGLRMRVRRTYETRRGADDYGCRVCDVVYIDGSTTAGGRIEGSVAGQAFQRVLVQPPHYYSSSSPASSSSKPEKECWVKVTWIYMGQDFADHHGSFSRRDVCGRAVRNERGEVCGTVLAAPGHGVMRDWVVCVVGDGWEVGGREVQVDEEVVLRIHLSGVGGE